MSEPNDESKGGRPKLTPEEIAQKKRELLSKIEPYLKTGLSVNKALREAHIGNREFYEYMADDESFREKINEYRQFVAVLLNNAIVREVHAIINKQNGHEETLKNGQRKFYPPEPLTKDDKEFLKWFALNNNLTKGEFGERKNITMFDPEAEIQKVKGIVSGEATKSIEGDNADYTEI